MPLYHIDVFMPRIKLPRGIFPLRYTTHARTAAQTDRYGNIPLPSTLNTGLFKVIELETNARKDIIKVVYKGILDSKRDIAIVCVPDYDQMIVKTVWANEHEDNHATLDRTKYATE